MRRCWWCNEPNDGPYDTHDTCAEKVADAFDQELADWVNHSIPKVVE